MASTHKILTLTELFALRQGAVITTPFQFTENEGIKGHYKPGDEIDLPVDDACEAPLRCRILDIEAFRQDATVRITLRKK